jgi:Fe-S cluster biogenesis protein NfuA
MAMRSYRARRRCNGLVRPKVVKPSGLVNGLFLRHDSHGASYRLCRNDAEPGHHALRGQPALLEDGRMMEFRTPEEAEGVSPLAAKILNLPFAEGVFIGGNFITVTKNDVVTWDLVQLELREFIQEFLNKDGRVLTSDAAPEIVARAEELAVSHAPAATPEEEKIISLLDEYVRPAVENDGGHIAFRSFTDGIVTVQLQGSCSGCQLSPVTLRNGVLNLLQGMMPGVTDVVAEAI